MGAPKRLFHPCIDESIGAGPARECMPCRTRKMRRCRARGTYKVREKAYEVKRHQEKPLAIRAKYDVRNAIRRGEIPRASSFNCCDCGKPATCYDHRDYLKPLNVNPVCYSCNAIRGAAANSHLRGSLAPRA